MDKLRERVPRAVLAAFVSCFVAGYIAHLFAITNIIPNADGISRVFDEQQMTISGRWFLHYASFWNGFIQSPAVIGFFAMLFLSLAAAFTVSLLGVERPLYGGLIGALMSVFPSVAYTFLYLFTASAYCFGILLAALAVWVTARVRWGFAPGALLLACAVGTYQAYLAVAASLALLRVVTYALSGGRSFWELFRETLRQLAMLVLGLGAYLGILAVFLRVKELELLDYKGISGLSGGLDLLGLLRQAASAYRDFVRYFFVPRSFANYTTPAAVVGNGALTLAGLWALIRLARRGALPRGVLARLLLLAAALLLPLGLNLTVLMGDAMPIMRYALVFAYVLALALADRAAEGSGIRDPGSGDAGAQTVCPPMPDTPADPEDGSLRAPDAEDPASDSVAQSAVPCAGPSAALRWFSAAAAVLVLLVSFNIVNLAYTVSAQAHRATESFATRLVERVESAPGYEKGMEVLIVGGFPSGVYYSTIEVFALVDDYSDHASSVIPLNKQVYYYLNDWLNVPWAMPPESELIALSDSEAFRAMPLYPSDGSVVVSEGRVIVKLAEVYKPKKPYEIAYENRR